MIARVWSARTTPAQAPAYGEYLKLHVIPQLRGIEGYRGATLLQRQAGPHMELQVVTMWESLDAIRTFAGPDAETAVVMEQAAALLTEYDTRARHFAVAVTDEAP